MRTNTTQFENSHGKAPRGRGNWWLRVVGVNGDGRPVTVETNGEGTLTEVRKACVDDFKRENSSHKGLARVNEVIVLP